MSAPSAAKRARPTALEATVTTLAVPGLSEASGIFVLADDTRLFSSSPSTILQLAPSGRLSTIDGNKDEVGGLKDGEGISARFKGISGLTVDRTGSVLLIL
jgi:hypothetical protein